MLNQPDQKTYDIEIVNNTVVNPITGRNIKIGGRVFNQLVSKNILKLPDNDETKVIFIGDDPNTALKVKHSLNITDDKHTLKVKDNKIVQERRRVTKEELQKRMQDVTLAVYRENASLFNDSMSIPQVSDLLQNLINERMINNDSNDKLVKEGKYILENIDSESEESESEEDIEIELETVSE